MLMTNNGQLINENFALTRSQSTIPRSGLKTIITSHSMVFEVVQLRCSYFLLGVNTLSMEWKIKFAVAEKGLKGPLIANSKVNLKESLSDAIQIKLICADWWQRSLPREE